MDHLQIAGPNIVGFSLGGAVALEMAAQRPSSVPRIGLINSLATYRAARHAQMAGDLRIGHAGAAAGHAARCMLDGGPPVSRAVAARHA